MPVWSEEDKLFFYQQTVLLGATQFEKTNDQRISPYQKNEKIEFKVKSFFYRTRLNSVN